MNRPSDLRIDLVRVAHPSNIQTTLCAHIDDGGLVVEGQDVGPGVEAIWGDLDYEYWLVVRRPHMRGVLEGLLRELDREVLVPDDAADQEALLLDLMKRAWGRGRSKTDVDFREWLDSNHIPSEFSSYV